MPSSRTMIDRKLDCVASAEVDAVYCASGAAAAIVVAVLVRNMLSNVYCNVEKCLHDTSIAMHSKRTDDAFEWFANETSGDVYVLRFQKTHDRKHAIAVENSARRAYDKDKSHAFTLSVTKLWACADGNARNRKITQGRII